MNEETQLTCMFNDISTLGKMLCWGLVLGLLNDPGRLGEVL